jgi:hypothetical protein
MRRTRDARTSPSDSFENRSGGGVGVRDAAKIELEVHRVSDQCGRTGVLQAPHVHAPQVAADDHTQNVAATSGADMGHVRDRGNFRAARATWPFLPSFAWISAHIRRNTSGA